MYNKITVGYVIQEYDKKGNCTGQRFIAGDQVEWEDENGNPINKPVHNYQYQSFDMVQPHQLNLTEQANN